MDSQGTLTLRKNLGRVFKENQGVTRVARENWVRKVSKLREKMLHVVSLFSNLNKIRANLSLTLLRNRNQI